MILSRMEDYSTISAPGKKGSFVLCYFCEMGVLIQTLIFVLDFDLRVVEEKER